MNKIFLVGNLTVDPQPKTTSTGKTYVRFTVAENERVNGKEVSTFFDCVAWNNQANFIGSYVKKGDMVAIDGKLTKRSYTNKEGRNVNVTEIIVDSIKTLVKRSKPASTANDDNLVSVNEQFATNVVDTEANFTKPQFKKEDDGLTELDWINEEEGK